MAVTPIRNFRAADEPYEAWRAAAEREGIDLSEWIRRACDARLRGVKVHTPKGTS